MDRQPDVTPGRQGFAGAAVPMGRAGEPLAARLEAARVLVVTGLIGSAELIEPYATASGITCQSYARGQSALVAMKQAVIASNPFHVVFVERVLPDMDPFELARQVKADKQLAQSRLILVSTFGGTDVRQNDEYFAHIAKPVKQMQVLQAVQAALAGDSRYLSAAPAALPLPAAQEHKHMILVAEDNPVAQMMVLLQLKECGIFAQVVTNGLDAVAAAKKNHFDAIFMDCLMPALDGFKATSEIRAWENDTGKPHTPIVAMTAYTSENDRQRCLVAGMDDYVSKPVTFEKLQAVLSRWLEFDISCRTEAAMNKQNDMNKSWDETGAPIDFESLSDMLGSTEAEEILHLFVSSTEELLERIDQAVEKHDSAGLQEAAHTLKGASSSIGALPLWQESIELEKAAKQADWMQIPQSLAAVRSAFEQAKTFIADRF